MKIIAFVPVKLNSERLPYKNILPIAGKPMCWHIVKSLLCVEEIDEVYVYCSNEMIMKYLPEGTIFRKRDKYLDGDQVKGIEIYDRFIQEIDADVYVLAHTTSPFIKTESIREALKHILDGENDSAFTAERIQTFAWYKDKTVNYDLNDIPRTQDLDPVWVETSGFYMFKREVFTEHRRRIGFRPYIKEVAGIEAIDIDEKKDYDLAIKLSEERINEKIDADSGTLCY